MARTKLNRLATVRHCKKKKEQNSLRLGWQIRAEQNSLRLGWQIRAEQTDLFMIYHLQSPST